MLVSLSLAACGGDEGQPVAAGDQAEQAFLEGMVPHHESALEMAKVAERRAQTPEIKRLAGEITQAQESEIEQMRSIHERLFGSELVPDEMAHEALGLTPAEAGIDHMDSAATLESAEPFERAFVDEMVPHDQGAVRMAQAVLPQTDDPELRRLAEDIVTAQEREIDEMNRYRTERYGGPVPPVPPSESPAGEQ